MTHLCGFDSLDCPEPENFAAVAKQLHETAQQAEERIYCMEQFLRYAVNRETYVMTSTADMGPFTSSTGTDPTAGSIIFSPAHTFANTFLNFPIPFNSTIGRTLPSGMWHIGAYVATFSVGAANDNTFRRLRIVKARTNPSTGGNTFVDEVSHTSFESANGVQILMTVSGVFKIEEGDRIMLLFAHGNTSSNVSIATGALGWFTKLSDADVVRVI